MKKRIELAARELTNFQVTELEDACLRDVKGVASNCVCITGCNGVCGCGSKGNCVCPAPKESTPPDTSTELAAGL